MASLEELEAKQTKMAEKAKDMLEHKDDPEKLLSMAAKLAEMGKDLEKSAQNLASQFAAPGGGDEVRVELTKDQRERIAEATGVPLEMLVVRDPDGRFASGMPTRTRQEVERLAATQVTTKAVEKARDSAMKKLLKMLEDLNEPTLAETIDLLKEDPSGETLKKKQLADAEAKKNEG